MGLLGIARTLPDQSLVEAVFADLDPGAFSRMTRLQVAEILKSCADGMLAISWQIDEAPEAEAAQQNVVPFGRPAAQEQQPASQPKRPKLGFDDIGGLEAVKAQMRRKIIAPFLNKGLFQQFRRKSGGGILMYGPPGCGKTMLARALAQECQAEFINVSAAGVLEPLVGLAEKRLAEIFAEARRKRPVVLFFDEIEALAQKRQFESTAKVNSVVSVLLTEMDGFESENEGVLLLGATNVPWSLDSAFRRPGRFDRSIFVPPPDKVARRFILDALLRERPVEAGINLGPVIERTVGFSGADLASLVETAVDFAIADSEAAGKVCPISTDHLLEALREVRPTTGEWLGQARNHAEYANTDGLYDDLAAFLKAHVK